MELDFSGIGLSEDQQKAVTKLVNTEFEKANESVRNVNSALKTEKQQAIDKANEYKAQVETLAEKAKKAEELEAKIEQLKKDNLDGVNRDEIEKAIRQDVSSEFSSKIEELESQLKALNEASEEALKLAESSQSTLVREKRDGGVKSAFLTLKANPEVLRAALVMARDNVYFKDVDGSVIEKPAIEVDREGNTTFRSFEDGKILSDENGNFSFTDWVKYLHESKNLTIFKDADGLGTNGGGIKKEGMFKSKMTEQQKAQYKKEFGYAAYNALPFSPQKEAA